MVKALFQRPSLACAVLAMIALMAMGAAALLVSLTPRASFSVTRLPDGAFTVDGQGRYPGNAVARFTDSAGNTVLAVPVQRLWPAMEGRGTPAENRAFLIERDRIAARLHRPGTRLLLPDGRQVDAFAAPGRIGRLNGGAWLALGIGLFTLLTGIWVITLRPREWAARMFLLSAAGFAVASVTIASYEQRSLALAARLQWLDGQINYIASFVFGGALVAMFARYPVPLVGKRWLAGMAGVLSALWLAGLADLWTDVVGTQMMAVLAMGIAIPALATMQAWQSRHDPAMRAAFALIGTALVLCIALFSATTLLPQLTGQPELVPLPVGSAVFLLFYIALAVAVARFRLFDIGNWAASVGMAALVLLGVLIADLLIVRLAGGTWTLSLAVLTAALIWLPVRELLLRRMERRRHVRDMDLLRGAGEVAFAPDGKARHAAWRQVLERRFTPLDIATGRATAAEIRSDGRELAVPSPVGGEDLVLRFAGGGRRLFSGDDRAAAEALVQLVAGMVEARSAYDRGAGAERRRIARDLHDDVGARLMTSLHRADLPATHADVREAMADMRLIIDGLSGQQRRLADILADLRRETVDRLTVAGIGARWPADAVFDDDRAVDAARNRVLVSVVRELASNVIRHSAARRVDIGVAVEDGVLMLLLHDDGCGFDAGADRHGNGLRNIARRLDEAGGRLDIASAPGCGTRIGIRLPLPSPEPGMGAPVPVP